MANQKEVSYTDGATVTDLCGLVIVVMVLGEEVNPLDGVRQVFLKVLSIHTGSHTAQVPIPYTACKVSGWGAVNCGV